MKIALLYSGIPIFNKEALASHKQYIWNIYNVDLYLSTYLFKDSDKYNIDEICNFTKFKNIDIECFSDIKAEFEQVEKKIYQKNSETNVINALSMFYKIHRCFSLIRENYDIVIRNRLDVVVDSDLYLSNNDGINVPCGGDHHGGLLDLFAFGSYTSMGSYCDLFNKIPYYIEQMNQNFHPESLLRFHCNYHNLPIYRFDYNLYLRKQLFTQTAPCIK